MALTPEQIDLLIQQADGLAPKEGSIFRALVKLTEAEVRKDDEALIRQLVEALEATQRMIERDHGEGLGPTGRSAVAAARARLESMP